MSDITFSIRFVDGDGNGVFNADVKAESSGGVLLGIGPSHVYHGYTDEDGWAKFEARTDSGAVHISHISVSRGGFDSLAEIDCDETFEDGDTASFTI
ncbi:MAG: hypothetical protein AAB605_00965 [Patescibacteria group bacterium]